ncbi:MAG TPA: hypothetical protein VL588_00935 [Bdellovibrionota bacterium]|nr:hypothetical protein [Bdellovibrionota bacterium]
MACAIALLSVPSPIEATTRLDTECRSSSDPPTQACGQCEPAVLSNFDRVMREAETGHLTSVEAFVGRMREIDPRMTNNFILIGDSKSLQGTSRGYPRIAFKSPESELWVTINTDPNAPGYNNVEVIRWNGARGRYDFQEVCFDQPASGGNPARGCAAHGSPHGGNSTQSPPPPPTTAAAHVRRDARETCVACHRNQSRPNFDTYVAWAGFIPPRDDVLEPGPDGNPSPIAAEYLRIMDRAAADHQHPSSPPSRWALLTVPPADGVPRVPGSPDPARDAAGNPIHLDTDQQRLDYIRQQIHDAPYQPSAGEGKFGSLSGFRIPHVPPRDELKNWDSATSDFAGFGHMAFDQTTNQNMCQIQTALQARPDFDEIKYSLAYVTQCYSTSAEDVLSLMPTNARILADDYFRTAGLRPLDGDTNGGPTGLTCQHALPHCPGGGIAYDKVCRLRCGDGGYRYQYGSNCSGGWEPLPGACSATGTYSDTGGTATQMRGLPGELFNAVREDTRTNQALLDTHKTERQTRYLENYLGMSHPDAVREGQRVRSVGEDALGQVSAIRYLLEPLGVPVREWSLSYGDNLSIPSYTFADQFDLFARQPIFDRIREEFDNSAQGGSGDYCTWLRGHSSTSFPQPSSVATAPPQGISIARETYRRIFSECGARGRVEDPNAVIPSSTDASLRASLEVAQRTLRSSGQGTLNVCMGCHSADAGIVPEENLFPETTPADTYDARLRAFLGTPRGNTGVPWAETIAMATDYHSSVPGIQHMPPNGHHGQGGLEDDERAAFLGYLASVTLSSDGRGTGYACEIIAQDEISGRTPAPAPVRPPAPAGAEPGE